MKKTITTLLLLATLVGGGIFLAGCSEKNASAAASAEKTLYTCGMHPQVIQDHPGLCPISQMKLTPIRKQAGGGTNAAVAESSAITIDPVTMQNMGFRSDVVTRGPLRRTLRTVAVVDFDETALHDVTTKFKGWIEKLQVDATGQQVHRGDALFEIYSPEL